MKSTNPERLDRTYAVRTQTGPIVPQALVLEQAERQRKTGFRPRLADIVADWLEEKGQAVVSHYLRK